MSTDLDALPLLDSPAYPADAIVPELYREMAAPRGIGEPLQDYRARLAALADITADVPHRAKPIDHVLPEQVA